MDSISVYTNAGSYKPGYFGLPVLSGTDPLEDAAFDLGPWRGHPNLSDGVGVIGV